MHVGDGTGETAEEWESVALGVDHMVRSGIGLNVPYIQEHVVADRFSVCRTTVGSLLATAFSADESPVSFHSLILSPAQPPYPFPFPQEAGF